MNHPQDAQPQSPEPDTPARRRVEPDAALAGSVRPGDAVVEDAAAEGTPVDEATADAGTSIYVRRGRTPTLGFWIVLSVTVPAVLAVIVGLFLGLGDLGSLFNFALLSVFAVGLPLAAVAAGIDAFQHRRRK